MTFQDAVKACLNNYATFTGRAGRPEFWYFFLAVFVVSLVANLISDILGLLVSLATVVPMLAVGARRLHDTGRSGWWQLIALVPLLGGIVLLILLAQKGETNANRFGAVAVA